MARTRQGWAAALTAGVAILATGSMAAGQQNQRDDGDRDTQRTQQQNDEERRSQQQRREQEQEREQERQRDEDRQDQDQRDQRDARDQPERRSPEDDQRSERQPDSRQQQQQGVMLGVAIEESPTTGVLIVDVLPGSAGQQAGLRSGDYILSIDDQRISSPQQFDQILSQMQPDDRAELTIWRDEQRQPLTVDFSAQQQARFRGQRQLGQDQQQFQDGRFQQSRDSQAWLGVVLAQEQDDQQRGVRISQVYPSGPASRAGLRSGDVVLRAGDSQVSSAQELARIIEEQRPGEQIELVVLRGEDEQPIDVRLGDRSEFLGEPQFQQGSQFQQGGQFGDFDQFAVPEHAMMLEQHRRLASQHQRLERLLIELHEEVQALRQEVQALSGQGRREGDRGSRTAPGLPQPPDDSAGRGRSPQRETLRPGFEDEQPGQDFRQQQQQQPGAVPRLEGDDDRARSGAAPQ